MTRFPDMRGGGSPATLLRRVLCAVPAVLAAALPAAAARDSVYAAERRVLEAARYLHEIEGNENGARALLDRLLESRIEAIRTQARYLDARFLEERSDNAGAARLYREALDGSGLEPAQKQRAVARLLALSPGSVRPFRDAGRIDGLPAQTFETVTPSGSEYVLVEERADPGAPPRLWRQDRRGLLQPLNAGLGPDEEVLDAAPDRVLTRVIARQRVILRRAPSFEPEILLERFLAEEGALLQGAPDEALVVGAQGIRHVRGGTAVFSHPTPGPACTWRPAFPRARQGVLFCPDHGVYRTDLSRRAVSPVPLAGELPSDVLLAGEYLVLRYMDHMEVRRGPAFDAFLWGFPAGLQDPVAVGGNHAFLATPDGLLRAFVLRTGQVDWQREDGASVLEAHDNELFVLTHARVLLAIDQRGRLLYSYEPGWDEEEPALLPAREWLVVHNADGRRVRLDRELLRLTAGSRNHLLRAERESLKRGDVPAALRELDAVLALEPGSGDAWREKARLLEASTAPREHQTRAWLQAARSQGAAAWSADPAFAELAAGLGATWVWKRQPGPRFFPSLTGGRNFSFYVENDNQTLVVLETRTGALKGTYRFPEALDLKIALWAGDTLAVSSPGRLYLVTPGRAPGILAQIPLRAPVCHSVMVRRGLLLSDWNGNVQLLDLASREPLWESKIGRGGVLFAPADDGAVDAFEIEGAWHRLDPDDGRDLATARLPAGTVTEVHAGSDFAYAGYNEGGVAAVNRATGTIAWQRDMGEQIFSLAGRGDQLLLIGTASRRVVNLNGRTGALQSQAVVASHLFNRPLLAADGYWVGTTEPALEKRSFMHEVLERYPLPDLPGTPTQAGNGIAVSTLDHFILLFPAR